MNGVHLRKGSLNARHSKTSQSDCTLYNVTIGLLDLTIRCLAFLVHLEISLKGLESNVLNWSEIQEDQTGGLV